MLTRRKRASAAALIGITAVAAVTALSGCSTSKGQSQSDGGKTTITAMFMADETSQKMAKGLIEGFEKENPDITVNLDTAPANSEGKNLVKTRLATGNAADIFYYNSGAGMQSMKPDTTLVDLSNESWVKDLAGGYGKVVSTDKGMYGAPIGTASAGGIFYNKKVYEQLGLSVPKSWSEFMANNEKIKTAGITPVEQSYGDGWTSQVIVLASYGSVLKTDPQWTDKYNQNQINYSTQPGIASFEHLQELAQKEMFNKDYQSTTIANAVKDLTSGKAAHYPVLSTAILSFLQQAGGDAVNNVGIFPVPANDASNTTLTAWYPNALYIPKSTTGAKLQAAKKFLAFMEGTKGCEILNQTTSIAGPYSVSTCQVPDDSPALVKDISKYISGGQSSPALEFLTPLSGGNLDKISIALATGQTNAAQAADAYNAEVVKQAKQLGKPGF